MIYALTIVFLAYLVFISAWHGAIWRKHAYIAKRHKKAANAMKAVLWGSIAYAYYHAHPFTWTHVFPAMVSMFVFQAFVWWALFDIAVNLAGGQKPFHMGETAATDNHFTHYWQKAIVQVIGVALSFVALLLTDSMI